MMELYLLNKTEYDAYKALAMAVIQDAIEDIFAETYDKRMKKVSDEDISSAVKFIFYGGVWEDIRNFWCTIADVNSDFIMESVVNRIRELKKKIDKRVIEKVKDFI